VISLIRKKKNKRPIQTHFTDNTHFLRNSKQTVKSETEGCPK